MTGIRAFCMAMAVASGLGGFVATGEPVRAETLTVGAAPSLKAAFQEIVPMFEKEYGATVHVVYGLSQAMRRQIEQGAPIDVFLPAAVEEVEKLHAKGLTLNGGADELGRRLGKAMKVAKAAGKTGHVVYSADS